MPGLPLASKPPGTGGHLIVVPKPWLFSHDGVEKVRYWVKTNVSPEPSARWIGTMSLCGSFRPELRAAIALSSHVRILPVEMPASTGPSNFRFEVLRSGTL